MICKKTLKLYINYFTNIKNIKNIENIYIINDNVFFKIILYNYPKGVLFNVNMSKYLLFQRNLKLNMVKKII